MKDKKDLLVQNVKPKDALICFQDVRNGVLDRLGNVCHTVHRVGDEHKNRISKVEYLADGRKLLTASWDKTAILWDVATGLPERRYFGHQGPIQGLCITPNEEQFVTVGDDECAKLWDLSSGKMQHSFSCHPGGAECAYVTPDGRFLLTGGRDALIIRWSLESKEPVCYYHGHSDNISALCLTQDGSTLLSSSFDGNVRLWDYETGTLIRALHNNTCANGVDITAEGNIVVAYADNGILIWSFSGELLNSFKLHTYARLRMALDREETGYINDFNIKENAAKLVFASSCSSLVSHKSRPYYFSTGWDKTCRQGDYEGHEIMCFSGHDTAVEAVSISPDDQHIATGAWDGSCFIWEIDSGSVVGQMRSCTAPVRDLSLSPEAYSLLTCGNRTLKQWDLQTGKAMDLRFEGLDSINSVAYELSGYTAAVTGSNGIAIIFDVKTGQERYRYEHKPIATTAVFSPDGSILAVGGIDGSITLHDIVLHRYVRNIKEDMYGISCMAISADFLSVLFAASGKIVTMHDICRNYTVFRFHHAAEVNAINLSNNGKHMAVACQNGEIYIWDLPTAVIISRFSADPKSVNAVLFSAKGERLYSGGSDGIVKSWDWRNQRLEALGRGHYDEITSLDLSKCGTRLYTGGNDHTVCCWDLPANAARNNENEAEDLQLLVTLHHLKEGYLWTTPQVAEIALSGWFWTDRRELINVTKQDGKREKVASLSEAKLNEYFRIYCRQDMVMDRLTSPERYKEKESRLHKIINKHNNLNLLEGEIMLQRRLKAPQE